VLASPGQARARAGASDIEHALQLLANDRNPWPGFDVLAIPLAVYDGSKTYLFRHPSPDEGFARIDGGAAVMSGRHPAINSNSSAEIGGVMTATVMADGARGDQPADEVAAVALHESFHVFQRAHHQAWSGNEGDMLMYPVEDARLLALRRQETEALRRSLATRSKTDAACWARVAMDVRRQRFAAMDSAFSRYERLTELNEGLATYLQLYARYQNVGFPESEFAATAVRQRTYTTGPALAYLLDRFMPGWRESLEANDRQFLDEMLTRALTASASGAACSFAPEDIARMEREAVSDANAVSVKRSAQRREFDDFKGWRIVIEAPRDKPLWPAGFDPLNTERVDGGLLHTRFASLKNDDGSAEALDGAGADITVFTEGPGPHPLFNGVTRAVIHVGAKPEVDIHGERRARIKVAGVTIDVTEGETHERDREVHIQLGK
jgi:hypothetical protein